MHKCVEKVFYSLKALKSASEREIVENLRNFKTLNVKRKASDYGIDIREVN